MGFLGVDGKTFAVFGIANRKSVGYHVGRVLKESGARGVWVAHTEARKDSLRKLLGDDPVLVCDVEKAGDIQRVSEELAEYGPLAGFVHSIAWANYSEGFKPFHETKREDFLQAVQISCHSLVELAGALKPHLAEDAAVVTISISSTTMAAENYGYMAPIKAALDSSVVFLAKSFSSFRAPTPNIMMFSSLAPLRQIVIMRMRKLYVAGAHALRV